MPICGIRRPTHPLTWCVSFVLALILIGLVMAGIVGFIAYLTIDPNVAQINITRAKIDTLGFFHKPGVLTVQISILGSFYNDNHEAHASFYDTKFALSFGDQKLAYLVAPTLHLKANESKELRYPPQVYSIRLNSDQADDVTYNRGKLDFQLKGTTRTRWRVWRVCSVKFLLNVDCKLRLPIDKSPIYPRGCSSRS